MVFHKKTRVIVIVGPTASGKSELAVRIAKKVHGEIISADSRQVYRKLNIGTAKVPGKWHEKTFIYKNIPHHCIDFVSPQKIYTAVEFKERAGGDITDIVDRQKIPIIAGGTGFWIDALIHDINFPKVAPNLKLRHILGKKSAAELLRILQKLDPNRAKKIEKKNPRRLIRAIEIAKTLGRVPRIRKKSPYLVLWIGLKPPPRTLKKRIEKRTNWMFRNGLIRETKNLFKKGVSEKRIHELGFEYQVALDYIKKRLDRKNALEKLTKETLKYAQRQMVWFKRNPDIKWVSSINHASKLISPFLHPIEKA